MADIEVIMAVSMYRTMLQQHPWQQIIHSGWFACVELPLCGTSRHWTDNTRVLLPPQICKLFSTLWGCGAFVTYVINALYMNVLTYLPYSIASEWTTFTKLP